MASSELERLLIALDSNVSGFREEMRKQEDTVKKSTSSMSRSFDKFQQSGLAALKRLGVGLLAAFSVRELIEFSKNAIAAGAEIADMARTAGVSAETLQELRFAFGDLAGTMDREVDESIRRFNRRLGLAMEGGGPAAKTFNALGVSLRTMSGEARSTEDVLDETMVALAGIENDALRAAKASEVFGEDAGPKLAAGLGKGVEAMEALRDATPGVLSDAQVTKAEELTDAFDAMAKKVGGQLRASFIEAAAGLAELLGIIDIAEEDKLRSRIDDLREQLELARLAAGSTSTELVNVLEQRLADLERRLKTAELRMPFAERRRLLAHPGGGVGDGGGLQLIDMGPIEEQRRRARLLKIADDFQRAERLSQLKPIDVEAMREAHERAQKLREEINAITGSVDYLGEEEIETFERMGRDAEQLGMTFGTALQGTLEDFFLGVEQDWGELLRRMAVRAATSGILEFLGSLGGGVGGFFNYLGFGNREHGGPVMSGQAYVVGERRPEIFIPNTAGRIEPRVPGVGRGDLGPVIINQSIQTGLPVQIIAAVQNVASEAAVAAASEFMQRSRGRA